MSRANEEGDKDGGANQQQKQFLMPQSCWSSQPKSVIADAHLTMQSDSDVLWREWTQANAVRLIQLCANSEAQRVSFTSCRLRRFSSTQLFLVIKSRNKQHLDIAILYSVITLMAPKMSFVSAVRTYCSVEFSQFSSDSVIQNSLRVIVGP